MNLLPEWVEDFPVGLAWSESPEEIQCNNEAHRLLGLSSKRMPLDSWAETLKLSDTSGRCINPARSLILEGWKGRVVPRMRLSALHPDGSSLEISAQSVPVDRGPGIQGVVVLFEDLSWMVEEQRRCHRWLGTLGHELKGALQPMWLAATRLGSEPSMVPPDAKRYADLIVNHCASMSRMVSDYIDAAKLGDGALSCHFATVEVARVCARLMEMTAGLTQSHPLLIQCPRDLTVWTDPDWLLQVLLNLVENAVKYSSPGQLVLLATFVDDKVVLSLSDQGPGIPKPVQAHLFQRFSRLPSKKEGSGIGLWLCRELIHRMGGAIWVDSDEGRSTSFYIALPSPPPS